jgi:putative cardiolipin synthase
MRLPTHLLHRRQPLCLAGIAFSVLFPLLAMGQSIQDRVAASCESCARLMEEKTGVYILEKGEESMIGRAWLAQQASSSIDIQYFIWSTDNIGILAAEALLRAADRGVTIRVLVDDFLIDAKDKTLLLLAAHPNVHIRIYNPKHSVGTSRIRAMVNTVLDFYGTNQRMHDKAAIFDGVAGITGGRNMAEEYFDYDHDYNFRDRDVLLIGAAVRDMRTNFNEFWDSPLAIAVEQLLKETDPRLLQQQAQRRYEELHAYARNPSNFEPEIRAAIEKIPEIIPMLMQAIAWEDVRFISDVPGKNAGDAGLFGGGESTRELVSAIKGSTRSILIQSPYLVFPEGGVALLATLRKRGVRIRLSTNSLASTDNLIAFSGYHKQRSRLLDAGIEVYEYKPHPQIQTELIDRYPRLARNKPIFALHAKSMVIDDTRVYIGTFNLDPRSANLNTEVGILVDSSQLGEQLTKSIERDMRPENSWKITPEFNPDREVSLWRRLLLWFIKLFPLDPIL